MSNSLRFPLLLPLLCGLIVLGHLAGGCGTSRAVRGSGTVIRQPLTDLRDFSAVELNGIGTVKLSQSGSQSVTIEAEDNLLPLLSATVANGTLRIGTKPNVSIRATRPVVFHVTADRIESIGVGGSGKVEAGDVKGDDLTVRVTGSGNVKVQSVQAEKLATRVSGSGGISIARLEARAVRCDISGSGNAALTGRADEIDVTVSGSGSFEATDLACRAADVAIAGSGNAMIGTTEQRITADVSGSGSLRYRGSPPQVRTHVSGSGSVSRAG